MNKKFELVEDQFIELCGNKLFRIRALVSFQSGLETVNVGDLGGYIESENNLSQFDNAKVSDDALVGDNAKVSGNARIFGDAKVSGNARVSDNTRVSDNACVTGNSRVAGDASVFGDANVFGDAWVTDNAMVTGNANVFGDACVTDNAQVSERDNIFWASNVGSEWGTLTVYKTNTGLGVTRGCFVGSVDEFLDAVAKKHGGTKIEKEYNLLIEVAKSRIL